MSRAPALDQQPKEARRGEARLELHLPIELKRRLAMSAAGQGKTIAAVAIEALENFLSQRVDR